MIRNNYQQIRVMTIALTAALPAVGFILFIAPGNHSNLSRNLKFDTLLVLLTIGLALAAAWP